MPVARAKRLIIKADSVRAVQLLINAAVASVARTQVGSPLRDYSGPISSGHDMRRLRGDDLQIGLFGFNRSPLFQEVPVAASVARHSRLRRFGVMQ